MRHRALAAATAVVCAALALGAGACSLFLDLGTQQCATDADCARFGAHPFCQKGLCVPSGLSPADCFLGTPATAQDFANQCSAAQCFSFDDCARIDLCGSGAERPLVAPPPPSAAPPATTPDGGAGGDGSAPLSNCLDPASGRVQVIYLTGSSNFPPLLAKLAPLLLATGFTPVYQVTSSCDGVRAVFSASAQDRILHDPGPGHDVQPAQYFTQAGAGVPCRLGPDGAAVDVGESDIFSTTCDGFGPPNEQIGEYLGPIQAMLFVTPGGSPETTISAEAARSVFGMGGDGGRAVPWTDPSLYFVRNASTGTQQMIARAIGVPADAFWGIDRGSAKNVDALLRVITDPPSARGAIGIISADYYDADRVNLKALAFKANAQECGYLPDSTALRTDKRNIRDGHYPIWGPLHFYTRLQSGVPVSAGAQAFISTVALPYVRKELLDAYIKSSLVPTCAMHVQRSTELGPLAPFDPPYQCGCYFDASPNIDGSPPSECTPCKTSNDCGADRPACNLGYCEAQ